MMDGVPETIFGLSLLGSFELTGPHGVVDLPSKKLAALLTYLACTAPQPQRRETLATLLWGSRFDAQAKQSLRQLLFRLRKLLGEDALEGDGEVVSLNTAIVLCDVGRFEALVREGSRDALRAAADLYRGRFIDDIVIIEEGWSEWLAVERERLQELALGAMVGLGEQELAAGRGEYALRAGQRANAINHLREDAHRLIIQALAATGRKAEALKYYQDLVALLKRELNTEPDAATRSLVVELRSARPTSRSSPVVEIIKPALPQPDRPSVAIPADVDLGSNPKQKVNAEVPTGKPSIAVLPFQNMSGDPDQEYFADGMVEDVTTALSRFKSFFVIARNSSFTYKGRAVDVKQVGRELGVRYVLEGSVRKIGNRVRITGRLIDTATGRHIWAERNDGELEDIFDLQDMITSSVAGAIEPRVQQAEIKRAQAKPTTNLTAHDLYMRAVGAFLELNEASYTEALALLDRAVAVDPQFSSAYGYMTWCHMNRLARAWGDPAEATARGLAAANLALQTGRDDSFALSAGGMALGLLDGRAKEGLAHVERALVLNTNDAMAWHAGGWVAWFAGKHEKSIENFKQAMRLSPIDPRAYERYVGIAYPYFFTGQYDEAIAWTDKALNEAPGTRVAYLVKIAASAMAGRSEILQEAKQCFIVNWPGFSIAGQIKRSPVRWLPEERAAYEAALRKAGFPE
jgi:TolB-like protein/DNA-binding SARP family transcriptional activator